MGKFDVFLCHNSADKPEVIKIANQLIEREIKPWLDIWELRPGFSWQDILEEQIKDISAAAVFIGSNGLGPWQEMELRAYLRKFVKKRCPVIPVIMATAPKVPELPTFLEGHTWVDFRKNNPAPIDQLIWGITGKKITIPTQQNFSPPKPLVTPKPSNIPVPKTSSSKVTPPYKQEEVQPQSPLKMTSPSTTTTNSKPTQAKPIAPTPTSPRRKVKRFSLPIPKFDIYTTRTCVMCSVIGATLGVEISLGLVLSECYEPWGNNTPQDFLVHWGIIAIMACIGLLIMRDLVPYILVISVILSIIFFQQGQEVLASGGNATLGYIIPYSIFGFLAGGIYGLFAWFD
jgi:hypothetical protein